MTPVHLKVDEMMQVKCRYLLVMVGMYWLQYMMGRMGKKQSQASSSLLTMATKAKWAHRSAGILLSVAFIVWPTC